MNTIDFFGNDPIYLNTVFENENKTKRFRIVKHLEKYISIRVVKFSDGSVVGDEVKYNKFMDAFNTSLAWLK